MIGPMSLYEQVLLAVHICHITNFIIAHMHFFRILCCHCNRVGFAVLELLQTPFILDPLFIVQSQLPKQQSESPRQPCPSSTQANCSHVPAIELSVTGAFISGVVCKIPPAISRPHMLHFAHNCHLHYNHHLCSTKLHLAMHLFSSPHLVPGTQSESVLHKSSRAHLL